ncbi:MAG TPA: pyridoxamine 5'-phosphate oxidase family protein [Tepidiformaceae bacterium]|nr:pyridoxamine 5'-phosphate oxidase family protein [Tepidiformaceae bacterium]
MRGAPRASRPHLPGYGVMPANEGEGLLPWSWAEEHLVESRNYWVATCRADGRPHLMAVWGIWHGASLWFSTGSESVKAKNLARDPRCSISTERGDEAVIVEGVVERVTDQPALKRVYEVYQAKYGWSMEGESFYVLRPRVVFAFFEHADQFASTATRWRFD